RASSWLSAVCDYVSAFDAEAVVRTYVWGDLWGDEAYCAMVFATSLTKLSIADALAMWICFFFSSRRRHTRSKRDWSSDVCSSDLVEAAGSPVSIVESSFGAVSTTLSLRELPVSSVVLWQPVLDLRGTFLDPSLPRARDRKSVVKGKGGALGGSGLGMVERQRGSPL